MKKRLSIIGNEQGFILPYVLFVIAISLLVITTNIQLYQNELKITERQIVQVEAETLFQMARTTLMNDLHENPNILDKNISYDFPEGTVTITFIKDKEYNLFFSVFIPSKNLVIEFQDSVKLNLEEI